MLRAIRDGSKVLLVVAALCVLGASAAQAQRTTVRISAPASVVAGKPCLVTITITRTVRGSALLQERTSRRWRTVARARLTRRAVTLRCLTVGRAGRALRLRAVVRQNGRTIVRSRTVSILVTPAATPPIGGPGPAPSPPVPPPDPEGVPLPPAAARIDPAQFGVEGTGGPPSSEALALLTNQRVALTADAAADLRAGRIDPRIIAVLTTLARTHTITVSAMCSDHPKFTSGGSISNHYFGRGVDIAVVDGASVGPNNEAAREIASALSSLDLSYRPDEVGTPWAISAPGYFTDAEHQDKIHAAFKLAIDPSWRPPA